MIKVSDYIADFLSKIGVRFVFGYIGGAIVNLVDSLDKHPDIEFIQFYHEQNAAFAAEGYARYSGTIGVATATSGPGATNMVTGIADAYFDSVPVLYITGQVNTHEYKRDKPIRQQGFQETDIISIVKPITKYAIMISEADKIRYELEKAVYLAYEGRPGPVVIDIPMNIQNSQIDETTLHSFNSPKHDDEVKLPSGLIAAIKASKRPIILAGGGSNKSKACGVLLSLAQKCNIPVVSSLMGKGCFPEDHPLYAGFIGSYGNRAANIILANSDLLIALGSRLDTRQTGTQLESFIRNGKIIHVDIDPNEGVYNRIHRDHVVSADVRAFVNKILPELDGFSSSPEWTTYVLKIKAEHSQVREIEKNVENKTPYRLMEILSEFSRDGQVFCVDIGQNQMFAAQMLRLKQCQSFYTSGGMAPMGYSLPCAIGASFAGGKDVPVVSISGDGGFQISMQSLMLLSQYNLPIKVIVMNNHSLGMIVQFQDQYFESRYAGTTRESGYRVPDISALAKAFSLEYARIDKTSLEDKDLMKKLLQSPGPTLIECDVGTKTFVSPKLQVNQPIEDLNPKLDRGELQDSMLIDILPDGRN